MKKIFWTTLVVLAFAVPFSAIAALSRFPTTTEEIMRHVFENTDVVLISSQVEGSGIPSKWKWFEKHLKEDGTSETVNTLARRSAQEFEHWVENTLRVWVRDNVDISDTSLAGKELWLTVELEKDVTFLPGDRNWPTRIMLAGQQRMMLGEDSDKLVIPESIYDVRLEEYILHSTIYESIPKAVAFFIPGIIFAAITVEDEQGKTVESYDSNTPLPSKPWDLFDSKVPRVYPRDDILRIPGILYNSEWTTRNYKRGKLTLRYRGGREEVFDRWDGRLLETTLPDAVPITDIKVVYDSVVLTVKAKPEDDIRIDFAPVVGRWEEQPNPMLTKSGLDERIISFAKRGDVGFLQVRRVPSTIKIR